MNSNTRIFRFTFRLSPKERQALDILAARENMPPGEFIRFLIRQGAESRGIHSIGLVSLLGMSIEEENERNNQNATSKSL